uniref:Pectinesterase 2-like n=1 Tax=Nicotiana sylvestris TaxID=4096 RepID=A0A1U7VGJ1_NICSY|nr:PREDICTED: pectinesterase 2-like [Nicotiana sylvestris]
MARGITFRNVAGPQMLQAVALRETADSCTFYRSAVFQNYLIEARMPLPGQYITITSQQKNIEKESFGLVLQNCTLKLATPDVGNVTMYLGRPWGDLSERVEFQGEPLVRPFYMQFKNRGPGANTTGRVKWARVTSDPNVASSFSVRNFIHGDKWIPSTVSHYLDLL